MVTLISGNVGKCWLTICNKHCAIIGDTINVSSTKLFYLFNCLHTFHFPHCVWNLLFNLLCTLLNITLFYFQFCGNFQAVLPTQWKVLHCNFQNVEISNCTYHIVKNITKCFPYCRNYWRLFSWGSFLQFPHCMEHVIQLTQHIVEHNIILLPVFWNVSSRSFRMVESFTL